MFYLRQETVNQKITVKMVDSLDGFTPEIGITSPTIRISKNDGNNPSEGSFIPPSDGTWEELEFGWYTVQLDITDTNELGKIGIHVEKAGSRNFDSYGYILSTNIYDSWFTIASNQEVKLASDGLDNISVTEPSGKASTFREMVVQLFMRFFNKVDKTPTQIRVYDNTGSISTTQSHSTTSGATTVGDSS